MGETQKSKIRAATLGEDAGYSKTVVVDGLKFKIREPGMDMRQRWMDTFVAVKESGVIINDEGKEIDIDEVDSANVMRVAKLVPELFDVNLDLIISTVYDGEPPHEPIWTVDEKPLLLHSHNPRLLDKLAQTCMEVMNEAIEAGKKASAATQSDGQSAG